MTPDPALTGSPAPIKWPRRTGKPPIFLIHTRFRRGEGTPSTIMTRLSPVAAADGPRSDDPTSFDLVVADASWTWTQRLFSPLADLGPRLLMLKTCDWRNAVQQGRPASDWFWPLRRRNDNFWERTFILPPGWMKSFPRLGMRPIARGVRRWREEAGSRRPWGLAISYPHYLHLRDLLKPDWLVYYNMDDYGLYWQSRRRSIARLERRVVAEADLSVFCARTRADELRDAVPEAADRIVHIPHGAPADGIASRPHHKPAPPPADLAHLPRPLLGFVGTLEDRLDWQLTARLADSFPNGSIVLIGRPPDPRFGQAWYPDAAATLDRPNVHVLGWRSQAEISVYSASFDVCLIPYLTDHPFNRASCPTKIMDYMATSRPVVTTAVPECRLHDHLFHVAESHDDFIQAVQQIVSRGSDDGRAEARWQSATAHTWNRTAEQLLDQILSRIAPTAEAPCG